MLRRVHFDATPSPSLKIPESDCSDQRTNRTSCIKQCHREIIEAGIRNKWRLGATCSSLENPEQMKAGRQKHRYDRSKLLSAKEEKNHNLKVWRMKTFFVIKPRPGIPSREWHLVVLLRIDMMPSIKPL